MENQFEIKKEFPVSPSEIYNAWLDSVHHTRMTGGLANMSLKENETFSAWDGYITGQNIKLIKDKEIVQSWRTSDFKENDEDSKLNIKLKATDKGTELLLIHTDIPKGDSNYKQGWEDHYFMPMKKYFEENFNA